MHVVGGLDRNTARVEGDALADEPEVVPVSATALVPHDDELRRLVAALGHGKVALHAQRPAAFAVEDLDLHAGFLGEGSRRVGDEPRRHAVRGLVRHAAGVVGRVADRGAARDRVAHRPIGHERHALDLRQAVLVLASPIDLRSPHSVEDALDHGLRRALVADRSGRQPESDFAQRRSPERPDPGTGDIPRAFGVDVDRLTAADEHHARLSVQRVDRVEPRRLVLGLLEAGDRGPRRAREPRGRRRGREERHNDRVDAPQLRWTDSPELHRTTSFRRVSVITRSRACAGATTRTRSSPLRRVIP